MPNSRYGFTTVGLKKEVAKLLSDDLVVLVTTRYQRRFTLSQAVEQAIKDLKEMYAGEPLA